MLKLMKNGKKKGNLII
ncbi:hypothetical protein Mgra_00006942 [Meloidogyne graminicola]|uniref:Uncharacterized protein n=1 Tax=Meloidogyne graminicola TaxID=189291 RepID=A0A8S9ZJM5_9BILA|nr:hypothetical protein Mgra_00006942 [Meloidogyne graminicola]